LVIEEKISFFDLVESVVKDKKRQVPIYRPRQKFEKEKKITNYTDEFLFALVQNNELGYQMGSSRMGFCIDFKDELTENRPPVFHIDLIWEDYSPKRKIFKPKKQDKPKPENIALVEELLDKNPKMPHIEELKARKTEMEDMAAKSTSAAAAAPTSENFAKILLKQGNKKGAIEIYKKLSLKYPEKSSYFASLIKELKK
jgi:hypothetical protein